MGKSSSISAHSRARVRLRTARPPAGAPLSFLLTTLLTILDRFARVGRSPMSLVLYAGGNSAGEALERRFFSNLRLPNGTVKMTYPGRLDDVNAGLLPFLSPADSLDIMDVAVSSGISTVEWSDFLTRHAIAHRLVAGDLVVDAELASWRGRVAVVFQKGGREPLLFEIGQVPIPIRSERIPAKLLRPLVFSVLRSFGRRGRAASSSKLWSRLGFCYQPIPLVTTDLRQNPLIQVIEDDIAIPNRFTGAFDVIRVANLVQRIYFDDSYLNRILRNLHLRLRDGGILVLCRTLETGVNRASIFRRTGGGFRLEESVNEPVEVCDLVLALDRDCQ